MPDATEKIKKEAKSEILVFFVGGAKLHAVTTHDKEELRERMNAGDGKIQVELDTVNEDREVMDDMLGIRLDKVLFYTILTKRASTILTPSPNGLIKS